MLTDICYDWISVDSYVFALNKKLINLISTVNVIINNHQ